MSVTLYTNINQNLLIDELIVGVDLDLSYPRLSKIIERSNFGTIRKACSILFGNLHKSSNLEKRGLVIP